MIQEITKVVNNPILDKNQKLKLILSILAADENVIQTLFNFVNARIQNDQKIIIELNYLLSKADIAIESPHVNKDKHVQKEIEKFYTDTKRVGHCFNKYNKHEKNN